MARYSNPTTSPGKGWMAGGVVDDDESHLTLTAHRLLG